MLTKEYINELKLIGNGDIANLVKEQRDSASIVKILEHLGHLPKDFDGAFLNELLNHKSTDVKIWAVKTIGKLHNESYLTTLYNVAINENDTSVRREAVSSIGRMRSKKGQKLLFKILNDTDPKVILQAIRGLLVFKGEKKVDDHLISLLKHDNETIKSVIHKEYFTEKIAKTDQPHAEIYPYLKNVVVNGDTIKVMRLLKEESIHLTFTSPPYYNARDYSIYKSYKHYLKFLRDVFKEVHRITKEGRFFILNTSPVIVPRVSRSHSSKRYPIPFDIHYYLMEMGWEFIDDIVWLKPEASVKNRIGGFMQHRKPLGYKPNSVTEYLMVYRKKTDKLLDWNMKQYDQTTIKGSKVLDKYESSNVWKIDPSFSKSHSAVFPEELCKRVIQYYSYIDDLIFDPFGGSGTLGRTALKFGRNFFMTEKDENYFEFIRSHKNREIFEKSVSKFLTFNEFKKTIV